MNATVLPRHRHRAMRRRTRARRVVALVAVLLAATVCLSYVRALTYPGAASWQARSVDWVRGHGGSGLVDIVENIYYSFNAPSGTVPAPSALPGNGSVSDSAVPTVGPHPAALPTLDAAIPLPGEAQWAAGSRRVAGVPALYTGWFRPDPAYPSQIVGVAWLNQDLVRTELVAGTREPGGGPWPEQAQVPTEERASLVAAFNSGWKMTDISGGYYAHGQAVYPLQAGDASLVIDTSGRASVGRWGTDLTMSPTVASVRQNLAMVVDGGRPVAGLSENGSGAWGTSKNQFQYTWRSGVGTDAGGNLVYVSGDKINLTGLARAMTAAGIVRGMELDIHTGTNSFSSFAPAPAIPLGARGTMLLPGMTRSADRYLVADQRDFFAVTLRPGTAG